MKQRIQIPEIFLGALLACAFFAMGMVFQSTRYVSAGAQANIPKSVEARGRPEPFSVEWFTYDAAGHFTALLFLVGALQACLFVWQLILIRRGLKPTEAAAAAALEAAQHVKKTERAYVRMSHEPPGLNPDNKKAAIQIKNFGKTPGRVMGVRLGPLVTDNDVPLPAKPPYEATVNHQAAQAFLHSGDEFTVRQQLEFADLDWGAVTRGQKTLYVIGLVEYVDVFGVWHRAGYARRYAHGRPDNNLPFVSSGAYSYDIVIDPSERLTRET